MSVEAAPVGRLRVRRLTVEHWPGAVSAVLLVAVLTLPIQLVSEYWTFVLASGVAYAVAALSVTVMYGHAGMIALFVAPFMGAGAWVGASIADSGKPWVLALLGAAAAGAALGALMGIPGIRLRGMIFGIVTFAAAIALGAVVFTDGFLGVDSSTGALMDRPDVGGLDTADDRTFYFVLLGVGALVWLVVWLHLRSRAGRAWRAIRDNELAALALGMRVWVFKVWAAALAGAIAALAGVLLLTVQSQSNEEPFTPFRSLLLFAATVTAGVRTLWGAVLAGALLVVLPQVLADGGVNEKVVSFIFAAGILVALRGSDGVTGTVADGVRRLTRRSAA